ncbi:hypothetical protein LT493_44275 [Streptomyces tricolor]|nr:hypothetical protein [Streptomyces tricolor]
MSSAPNARPSPGRCWAQLAEIIEPLWRYEGMERAARSWSAAAAPGAPPHAGRGAGTRGVREAAGLGPRSPLRLVDGGRSTRPLSVPCATRSARSTDLCYDVTAQLGVRHHVARAELKGRCAPPRRARWVPAPRRDPRRHHRTGPAGTHRRNRVHELPVTHTATPGLGAERDEGRPRVPDLARGSGATVDITTAADGEPLTDGLWGHLPGGRRTGITQGGAGSAASAATDVSGAADTRIVATGGGLRAVTLYTTKPYGNFTLDLGETKHKVPPLLHVDEDIRWADGARTELRIGGRCDAAEHLSQGALVVPPGRRRRAPPSPPFPGPPHLPRRCLRRHRAGRHPSGRSVDGRTPASGRGARTALPALPAGLAPAKWRRGRHCPGTPRPLPGRSEPFALALKVAKTRSRQRHSRSAFR